MPEKGPIRVTVAGATDVGQVRDHNEDNLLVADLTAGERLGSGDTLSRELGEKGLLFAVADGMGGAASGELASEMAVDTVYETATSRVEESGIEAGTSDIEVIGGALSDCVNDANTRIFEKSQAESEHRGMGTTMTAAWGLDHQIAIAQVGDSRAYLLRKGKLVQVTKDQSLISQLIEDGTLTEEEAERLGGRNIILQALGVEEGVTVETKTMEVLDGDLFLLCSDGLTGMVKDEVIEEVISNASDLGVACGKLIQLANEGGGRDNITVILARFEGEGLRAPMQPLSREEGVPAAPTYVAPEVPEAKSPRTRLLFGGIAFLIVAVVVFFLLVGGNGDVTFRFPVADVSGTLSPLDGEGETVALAPAAGASEFVVEGVASGKYRVTARHPDYEDFDLAYDISGGAVVDVAMRPKPGTVVLQPALARVTVTIRKDPAEESDSGWSNQYSLETKGERKAENVPAGDLRIVVAREAFRPATVTAVLPPNGSVRVDLPELEPITGKLEVTGSVPGMNVEIRDDWGDVIWSAAMPDSGRLDVQVRVGEHSLKATHEKFETYEDDVTIVEGETFLVRIPADGKPGSLALTGPVGGRVAVTSAGGTGWEKRQKIPEGGRILFERVPPGRYDVRLELPDRPTIGKVVTVEAAVEATVEFE